MKKNQMKRLVKIAKEYQLPVQEVRRVYDIATYKQYMKNTYVNQEKLDDLDENAANIVERFYKMKSFCNSINHDEVVSRWRKEADGIKYFRNWE